MGKNNIATKEAGEALGQALAHNSMLKELDISGDGYFTGIDGPGFAKGIADGISANGALTSLDLSRNELRTEGAKHVAQAIKGHVSALRFDWYHFERDLTFGSTAVVYGYSYYNTTKGALETITFGDKQAVTMKTSMTEAKLSGKELGASGAIIVAAFLPKCQ